MSTTTSTRPVPGTQTTNAAFAGIIAAERYRERIAAHQEHTARVAARYEHTYKVLWTLFAVLGAVTLGLFIAFAITKSDQAATAAYAAAIAALVFFLAPCILAAVELQQQKTPGPIRTR
ncbi:hypothetical protein [Leifsonia aquatica]|uniref:hypothetical protein n=1 Tax=Leifsonia aquatica TaxID=144185 RepID=UPI003830645F